MFYISYKKTLKYLQLVLITDSFSDLDKNNILTSRQAKLFLNIFLFFRTLSINALYQDPKTIAK